MRLKPRPGEDVRLVWMLAALVLALGYYFIDHRYQQAIGMADDHTAQLYHETVANRRVVQRAAELRSMQERVFADLHGVLRAQSSASTTAAMLSMLDDEAKRCQTHIIALTPEQPRLQPSPQASPAPGSQDLSSSGLTIKVRGHFRDILHLVEALPKRGVLLSVSDTQLALANGTDANAEPLLEATVHATVYRVTNLSTLEART